MEEEGPVLLPDPLAAATVPSTFYCEIWPPKSSSRSQEGQGVSEKENCRLCKLNIRWTDLWLLTLIPEVFRARCAWKGERWFPGGRRPARHSWVRPWMAHSRDWRRMLALMKLLRSCVTLSQNNHTIEFLSHLKLDSEATKNWLLKYSWSKCLPQTSQPHL